MLNFKHKHQILLSDFITGLFKHRMDSDSNLDSSFKQMQN